MHASATLAGLLLVLVACKAKPQATSQSGGARTITVPVGAPSAAGFGAATPVVTTGPAPEIPDEPTQKRHEAVASAKGALRRCYDDALSEVPYLSIQAEVTVHVDEKGRGTVKKIEGLVPDGFGRCVTNVLTGVAYPRGHEADLVVPLSYRTTTL